MLRFLASDDASGIQILDDDASASDDADLGKYVSDFHSSPMGDSKLAEQNQSIPP